VRFDKWHDQTKVGNYNEGIRIPETWFTDDGPPGRHKPSTTDLTAGQVNALGVLATDAPYCSRAKAASAAWLSSTFLFIAAGPVSESGYAVARNSAVTRPWADCERRSAIKVSSM
jgi:hypothetical protein